MTGLKDIRESLGITQKKVADIIGVSKANYCKKENGQVKFSLDEAFLIANYFGKTVDSIFESDFATKKKS